MKNVELVNLKKFQGKEKAKHEFWSQNKNKTNTAIIMFIIKSYTITDETLLNEKLKSYKQSSII